MDNVFYWIGMGALFFIAELLTGSGFLLFFGASAFIVAGLPWLFPSMHLSAQAIIFSILAVLSALGWKIFSKHRQIKKSDKPFLNKKAAQYVGQKFTLKSAITNGMGRINIGDTVWQVRCSEDLPIGTKVAVIGVDGAVLMVKSAVEASLDE